MYKKKFIQSVTFFLNFAYQQKKLKLFLKKLKKTSFVLKKNVPLYF